MMSLLAIIVTLVLVASALLWRAVLKLSRAIARLAGVFREPSRAVQIPIDRTSLSRSSPGAGRGRPTP